MKNKEFVYDNALKFLKMLKRGKQIKTRSEIERLDFTMEQLESLIYEEKKINEEVKKREQQIWHLRRKIKRKGIN